MEINEEYLEIYYDVVEFITREVDNYYEMITVVSVTYRTQGRGGMYELAKKWCDEFMEKYKDVEWGNELEYYDTIENFLRYQNEN